MNEENPEEGRLFEDGQKDGRVRSGKARMAGLTPQQRSELAKKAATSRWLSMGDGNLLPATHMGEIKLAEGHLAIPCAVLSDGTRVLTQAGFLEALGRKGGPKNTIRNTDGGFDKIAPFLAAENLKPFIPEELKTSAIPVPFRMTSGVPAWGYRADLLPKVCEVYLKAQDAKALLKSQDPTATACGILVRGLAQVGIVALVDEATGFQKDRARDALARILEAYIAKELQKWVKTFPLDFYEQMFRLRQIPFDGATVKRPGYVGHLTNDLIYSRLAPGVLDELKRKNPKSETGARTARHHQWLSRDQGHPKLSAHIASVTTLMKASDSWDQFKFMVDKALPKFVPMPLFDGLTD